jgi:pimeloyl-ACP methyl ester carboxylesterase
MLDPKTRWLKRINQSDNENYDLFARKWLTDVDNNLDKPSIFILNGWQAWISQNQWYADAQKDYVNMFAYDSRGQGASPKHGRMDTLQNAIDAQKIIGKEISRIDKLAEEQGIERQNKILHGNCLGTMTISTLFAGKFDLANDTDGVILLSPVSSFNLPMKLKITYFLPIWMGNFVFKYLAEPITKSLASGDGGEISRNSAMDRLRRIDLAAASRQVKDIFWKEDVSKLWRSIDKPALLYVGKNDPLVRFEDSFDPYDKLRYPIWIDLHADNHFLLEENVEKVSKLNAEFSKDPWKFYDKYKDENPVFK